MSTPNKLRAPAASALVREPRRIEPWRTPDWQRLWLSSQAETRPWRTMALVPAGPGVSNTTIMQIAVSLAHTGMTHLGTPVHVANGTGIGLHELSQFIEELKHYEQQNAMVLLALSALNESVTTASLVQAADCALLCVVMRVMAMSDAKKTVNRIGKERFIGSALFHAVND